MNVVARSISVFLSFTLIFNATIQPIGAANVPRDYQQVRSSSGDLTDSDGDGISDLAEGDLGLDPYREDSDFDGLTDQWELDNGLDPLDPDKNDDGMLDGDEITLDGVKDPARDSDGDGTPNIDDEDNDNDGVRDLLDLAPQARSEVAESFSFDIQTSGKPLYFDLTIRPENPQHLEYASRVWDWPFDEQGQMQDLDKTTEDLKLNPMLEFNAADLGEVLSAEAAADYGIRIDGDVAYVPLTPLRDDGVTVALTGKLFLPATDEPLNMTLEAHLTWMVNATTDHSELEWTTLSGNDIGSGHQGGGAAFADLNGNDIPDLILMGVHNREGPNDVVYRIGWDMNEFGFPEQGWGVVRSVIPFEFARGSAGGGVSAGDIDGNGTTDLLVFGIDDTSGANELAYLIGWNLDATGTAANWTKVIEAQSVGNLTDGGGAALADINGNGTLDLLLMGIDDPDGENQFRYRIGWDLDSEGKTDNWTGRQEIPSPGLGYNHEGGGAALGDVDGNGVLDLLLMGVDASSGQNELRYMVGWNLDSQGKTNDWSGMLSGDTLGESTAGGGAALADLNGNGSEDVLFMAIDDPPGENNFRYRVGWDLTSDGTPTRAWSGIVMLPEDQALGNRSQGAGAVYGDINQNGTPDLLLMAIDDPDGVNQYRYRVGWDVDARGIPTNGWSAYTAPMRGSGVSSENAGGGAELADIDGNGVLDLLLMSIDQEDGANDFHYQIGWNLTPLGVAEWSDQTIVPGIGNRTQGGGVAITDINGNGIADLLLMGVDNPKGPNQFRYRIGWDLAANGQPTNGWSDIFRNAPVDMTVGHRGGGAKFADLNQNGLPDLILSAIDDPSGPNRFQLVVAWDLGSDGIAASSSPIHWVDGIGNRTAGGGLAVADLDGDGFVDLSVMGVDNPAEGADGFRYRTLSRFGVAAWGPPVWADITSSLVALKSAGGGVAIGDIDDDGAQDMVTLAIDDVEGVNDFRYRVGWTLNADGNPRAWSDWHQVPGIAYVTQGGGAELADIDGNGVLDLIVMGVADLDGENQFRYRIGWNLDANGIAQSWSGRKDGLVSGVGSNHDGGGVAIADINDNGQLDVLLMGVDSPDGANELRYIVGWDLDSGGNASSWSGVLTCEAMGNRTSGGGTALADFNNNGSLDLVMMAIDNPKYGNGFRYRIGWDLDAAANPSHWSRTITSSTAMLGVETSGGGAAIADVTDDGRLDLMLMTIDDQKKDLMDTDLMKYMFWWSPQYNPWYLMEVMQNPDYFELPDKIRFTLGAGMEPEQITLARYRENFSVTGFTAQENFDTEVGVFHDGGDRDGTMRGYLYLYYNYLHDSASLADAYDDMRSDPNNLTVSGPIEYYSHTDAALAASSDHIRDILEGHPENDAFPLLLAFSERTATLSMNDFTSGGVVTSSSSFSINLTAQDKETNRFLQMPWYDAAAFAADDELVFLPLTVDRLVELAQSWGLTDEEEATVVMHLVQWSAGELLTTQVNGVDIYPAAFDEAKYISWVAKGTAGLSVLLSLPARFNALSRFFSVVRGAGYSLLNSARGAREFYSTVKGVGGVAKAAKWLGRAGMVFSVAVIGYMAYSIIRDEGADSSFGWAVAGLAAGLNLYYLAVLGVIASIPVAGAALVGLVVLSDFIVMVVTGSAWSQSAINTVVDLMADSYTVSGVDLVVEKNWTEIDDPDNNGFTPGDSFTTYTSYRGVATAYQEGPEDLDDTWIKSDQWFTPSPSSQFESGYGASGTDRIDFGNKRWDRRTIHAWLRPLQPAVNMEAELVVQTRWATQYKECVDWSVAESCDEETASDDTESRNPIYIDVLPSTLDELLAWQPITLVNAAPRAVDDRYQVEGASQLSVTAGSGLLANDMDPDGDGLTAQLVRSPEYGDLSLNPDGSFSYQVKAEAEPYYGFDYFIYRVQDDQGAQSAERVVAIEIYRGSNQTPQVLDDQFLTDQDEEIRLDVLANDQDGDGDSLTIRALSQPDHGTVAISGDQVLYTPEEGWFGTVQFKYVAGDGDEAGDRHGLVEVTVQAAEAPRTEGEQYTIDEDQPLVISAPGLLANDWDPQDDPIHVHGHTEPAHGTLSLTDDGAFSYTPNAHYHGQDEFIYVVADDKGFMSIENSVSITINAINDVPLGVNDEYTLIDHDQFETDAANGVLANDEDPDVATDGQQLSAELVTTTTRGSLSLRSNGAFRYNPRELGIDTFTYRATDGSADSELVTVTLDVRDSYRRDLAVDDRYVLALGGTLRIDKPGVMANDLVKMDREPVFPSPWDGVYTGVNDDGALVGHRNLEDGSTGGIYLYPVDRQHHYSSSRIEDFADPASDSIWPNDINDDGVVVGTALAGDSRRGFFAEKGAPDWSFQPIAIANADQAESRGLNDQQHHVGMRELVGVQSGYHSDGIQFDTITVPGADSTVATDVDSEGRILGYYGDNDGHHGFLYDPATDRFDLIDVPAGTDTELYGISDTGVLVGQYTDFNNRPIAIAVAADGAGGYRFSNVIGSVRGSSSAQGINDKGWVVGYFQELWSTRKRATLYIATPGSAKASLVDPPQYGILSFGEDGSFTYTFSGCNTDDTEDSFTYTVEGRLENTEPARVTIEIPRRDTDGDGVVNCADDDDDNDLILDTDDNCQFTPNPDQADSDADGIGNVCDNCPVFADPDQTDSDGDGVGDFCDPCTDMDGDGGCEFDLNCIDPDEDDICLGPPRSDNCPLTYNPNQEDGDGDYIGDACDYDTDLDQDGVWDTVDNCPGLSNPDQLDADRDGIGDACDNCADNDLDGICVEVDSCPLIYNPQQEDLDGDGIGDLCDVCIDVDGDGVCDHLDNCLDGVNPDQFDTDGDGIGDQCDPCTDTNGDSICEFDAQCVDTDLDGICLAVDNCPLDPNADQADDDNDGQGNACDTCQDPDADGVCTEADNCPLLPNHDQLDADGDGRGDVCDLWIDLDGDNVADEADNCPATHNPFQEDEDGDGIGDLCDLCLDADGDGICLADDNCPAIHNPDQIDLDGDGKGDLCDSCVDVDRDGVCDKDDNCPTIANPDQLDADLDDVGDLCDASCLDSDHDGICDDLDNCPMDPNPDQADRDSDGFGDPCDQCLGATPTSQATLSSYDGSASVTLDASADCLELVNPAALSPADAGAPQELEFPVGLFSFELHQASPGMRTAMDILVPLNTRIGGYLKQSLSSGEWLNVAAAIDHQLVPDKTRITINLIEGGTFDRDEIETTITDRGGPVLALDARCGAADGSVFETPPSADLCAAGSAGELAGDGPWNWTCFGLYGGLDASCATLPTEHPISVAVTNTDGGQARCTPNPVQHGETTTCTANPNIGYLLSGWSGDCTGAHCELTAVDGNRQVTALFTTDPAVPTSCHAGPVSVTPPAHTRNEVVRSTGDLSTSGDVVVANGQQVAYVAATHITLSPGFHARPGAAFQARMAPSECPATRETSPRNRQQVVSVDGMPGNPGKSTSNPPLAPRLVPWRQFPSGLVRLLWNAGVEPGDIRFAQSDAQARQLVFSTDAALAANDTNGLSDVYLYSTMDQQVELISIGWTHMAGNGPSDQPRIDGRGEYIVFRSEAQDLGLSPDTNGVADIYLHQIETAMTRRVSWSEYGHESVRPAAQPDLGGAEPDVVYQRRDTTGQPAIYGYSPLQGYPARREDLVDCDAHHPRLSPDGRYLAYMCGDPVDPASCELRFIDRQSRRFAVQECPSEREAPYRLNFSEDGKHLHWILPETQGSERDAWSENPLTRAR